MKNPDTRAGVGEMLVWPIDGKLETREHAVANPY